MSSNWEDRPAPSDASSGFISAAGGEGAPSETGRRLDMSGLSTRSYGELIFHDLSVYATRASSLITLIQALWRPWMALPNNCAQKRDSRKVQIEHILFILHL